MNFRDIMSLSLPEHTPSIKYGQISYVRMIRVHFVDKQASLEISPINIFIRASRWNNSQLTANCQTLIGKRVTVVGAHKVINFPHLIKCNGSKAFSANFTSTDSHCARKDAITLELRDPSDENNH